MPVNTYHNNLNNYRDGIYCINFAYDRSKGTGDAHAIPDRSSGIAISQYPEVQYSGQRRGIDLAKWAFQQTGGLVMADEGVLTAYIQAAMKQNKIEKLEDGTLYCEIPSCPGVWANENTVQECIAELRQALELWLVLKIKDNDPLPILGGIDLNKIGSECIEADE